MKSLVKNIENWLTAVIEKFIYLTFGLNQGSADGVKFLTLFSVVLIYRNRETLAHSGKLLDIIFGFCTKISYYDSVADLGGGALGASAPPAESMVKIS